MFLRHSKDGQVVLIVDVGNSSVGGALALVSSGTAPKILYSFRSNIVWHEPPEKGHFLISITKALEHVMEHVVKRGLHFVPKGAFGRMPIHRSHIIFSSPWYISETKIIKFESKSLTLVTQNLINQMLKGQEQRFETETETGDHSLIFKNAEIVEQRVIRTRLNGYITADPFGKKASNIEVTFFVSLISKDILVALRKIIGGHFHIKNSEVSSFPLAAFNAFASAMPKVQDFLMVDVRGELTDVSVVRNGALLDAVTFAQGKNSLVRSVAEASSQSSHSALSALKIALHGHGTPDFQVSISKLTEPFKVAWMASYAKALEEIAPNGSAPKTVFLIGDPETEIIFENVFNEIKGAAEVFPLKRSKLRSYVEMSSAFSDPFLALETVFVNQLLY